MTEKEREKLKEISKNLTDSLVHTQYLLANSHESFIDRSSLRALQNDLTNQIEILNDLIN